MKTICITGALQQDVDLAKDSLNALGMATALPSGSDPSLSFNWWHEHLLKKQNSETGAEVDREVDKSSSPGRIWERLAGDLFLANLDAPVWGWAHLYSVHYLEFWLDFDPAVDFVLVCARPERVLATAMMTATQETPVSVEALLHDWLECHQRMLKFHYRHSDRSMLVDADLCIANPGVFQSLCVERWSLRVEHTQAVPAEFALDPLAMNLARQIVISYPEVTELQHELDASGMLVSDRAATESLRSKLEADSMLEQYRNLRDRAKKAELITTLQEEVTSIQLASSEAQRALSNELKVLGVKLSQTEQEAAAKLAKQQAESETLLLHLKQAQDDLESLLEKNAADNKLLCDQYERAIEEATERKQQNDTLQLRVRQLDEEMSALIASPPENQAQAELLRAADKRTKDLCDEKDLILLQLQQVQEELGSVLQEYESNKKLFCEQQELTGALTAERQHQINAISDAEKRSRELKSENEFLLLQVRQLDEELSALVASPPENQAQAELLRAAEQRTKDLCDENDLILLQLQQVQQELGSVLQEYESNKKLSCEYQELVGALTAERQHQINAINDAEKRSRELKRENDFLLLQLQHVKEEMGSAQQQNERNKKLLSEQYEISAALTAERKKQIHTLDAAEANCRDLKQENELLLLQLHQVQEELQYYFLQHQKMQKQLEAGDERLQRILLQNQQYIEYASLHLESSKSGTSSWVLRDLYAAGRHFPELRMDTCVEAGCAGIVFHREQSPFLRWPAISQQSQVLTLQAGNNAKDEDNLQAMRNLGTSDWNLLQTLIQLLQKASVPEAIALREGLEPLRTMVEAFPETIRFDHLSLLREQVNPDYEHLWLRFGNMSFGKQVCTSFEFRLSCAHVAPGMFGHFPKLEFPEEAGKSPFESWFVEAHDDFGAKLEVRFALPGAIDLAVLNRLSKHDQLFLRRLVDQLPHFLRTLEAAGVVLRRPWQEWLHMTDAMQKIMRKVEAMPLPVSALGLVTAQTRARKAPAKKKSAAKRKAVTKRKSAR